LDNVSTGKRMRINSLLAGLLIIFLSVCGLSCREPVGSIDKGNGNGNGNGNGTIEDFFLLVFKDKYYLNKTQEERSFYRNSDYFRVIGLGKTGRIDQNDNNLKIEIVNSPLSIGPDVNEVIGPFGVFEFSQPGTYLLKGTYNEMTDEWPIEVFGSDIDTGEGSPGIDFIWLP